MDVPDLAERTLELGEVLDRAMEAVRTLSQDLDSSPVRRLGLKNALLGLAKRHSGARRQVTVRFSVSGTLPPEVAEVIYQAASQAVIAAAGRADVTRIRISATGARIVTVRVADNGKTGPDSSLAMAAMLARHAGLSFETATGKGTIVSIRHAIRRTSGR
jgi:signal transduction histidine kinase